MRRYLLFAFWLSLAGLPAVSAQNMDPIADGEAASAGTEMGLPIIPAMELNPALSAAPALGLPSTPGLLQLKPLPHLSLNAPTRPSLSLAELKQTVASPKTVPLRLRSFYEGSGLAPYAELRVQRPTEPSGEEVPLRIAVGMRPTGDRTAPLGRASLATGTSGLRANEGFGQNNDALRPDAPIGPWLGLKGSGRYVTEGKFGEVYRIDSQHGPLAVKVPLPIKLWSPKPQFLNEARALKDLGSKFNDPSLAPEAKIPDNVRLLQLVAYGSINQAELNPSLPRRSLEALVTAWAPGKTLKEYVLAGGKIKVSDWEGLRQAFERLHALGYAHGDVDDANIMVVRDARAGRTKFTIMDFGLVVNFSRKPLDFEPESEDDDPNFNGVETKNDDANLKEIETWLLKSHHALVPDVP